MNTRFSSMIILLIFLFSFGANAQKNKTESPYLTEEPIVPTDTSEFNRRNKTISLYGELTVGTKDGYTLDAAYFLRPDLQLMLEYSNFGPQFAIFKKFAEIFSGYTTETIDTGYGLHLKYFMGNSIYLRIGASQRKYSFTRTFSSNGAQSYFDADLNTVTVGFGNDWQWDNFFFGVEWYKLNLPVGMTVTNERVAAGDNISAEKDSVRSETSGQIGIHLGLSF